jgi:hypothetical protein
VAVALVLVVIFSLRTLLPGRLKVFVVFETAPVSFSKVPSPLRSHSYFVIVPLAAVLAEASRKTVSPTLHSW